VRWLLIFGCTKQHTVRIEFATVLKHCSHNCTLRLGRWMHRFHLRLSRWIVAKTQHRLSNLICMVAHSMQGASTSNPNITGP
jgi:hypothetical protein